MGTKTFLAGCPHAWLPSVTLSHTLHPTTELETKQTCEMIKCKSAFDAVVQLVLRAVSKQPTGLLRSSSHPLPFVSRPSWHPQLTWHRSNRVYFADCLVRRLCKSNHYRQFIALILESKWPRRTSLVLRRHSEKSLIASIRFPRFRSRRARSAKSNRRKNSNN